MEFICNFELEIVHAQDTESVNACFNPEFIYSKVNFVARINSHVEFMLSRFPFDQLGRIDKSPWRSERPTFRVQI